MIDLHMHTVYSDGADSVLELLDKAQKTGLEYIAITDHDTCEAYNELKTIDVKQHFKGTIIPGVEIKCAYGNRLIEILGYKVDTSIINEYMEEYHKTHSKEMLQTKYFNILYEKCIEMELILSNKNDIEFDPKRDWASVTIYKEIKSHEENKEKLPEDLWQNFTIFSKKYCGNPNSKWFIDKSKDYLSVQEAVDLVKKAKGLVFIPHIFIYKWAEDPKKLLDDIVLKYEIDGIECMHSEFTQEQIEYLLDYTEKNNLFRSGGSDYHGKNKIGIEMAVGKGNLKIPTDFLKRWF